MRSFCATRHKQHQRLISCTKKIAIFAHAFAPYFDVVHLVTESDATRIGFFWGLLQLVFQVHRTHFPDAQFCNTNPHLGQVGSDYLLFLERTCDAYKALAHALPQYQHIYTSTKDSIRSKDGELCVLLSHVYADIVRFNLELYCMFSSSSQGAFALRTGIV